jgi:alpha-L-fucosidase
MDKFKKISTGLFIIFMLVGSSCTSEVKNKPTWETMKYGLFVHYVFGGEFGGMTPMGKNGGFPANIDEFVERFDVEKFASDVQAMGFEYVIFTAWHANMGVLYPSKVMEEYGFDQHDHFTSQRDLLGDLIEALGKRGIQFAIYSYIFVGHDFHPQGTGYYMYNNKDGIITDDMVRSGYVEAVEGNSQKWDDFVCAVYDEMSTRYGDKVSAYWFDGSWVPWVDKQRIMETIWKTNKDAAMVANGTPDHGMPYCSKEVASPEGKDYGFLSDYPPVKNNDVTTWPAYERNIALIQGGNWWASVNGTPKFDAETVYRFTVFEAAVNTGGGVSWSFSPFVDGTWEGDMLERMKKVNAYLEPVAESVKNTRPSTSFITKEGTKISTLENGFVATRSADGKYEYIHVLNRRSENFIVLPESADGRVYGSAMLLKDGQKLDFHNIENGYVIVLPEGKDWDPLNTVIRLSLSKKGKKVKTIALEDLGIKTGIAPSVYSAKLTGNGLSVDLEFNKSLKNLSGQVGNFSITINGIPVTIDALSHDFKTAKFVLSAPARMGEEVFLSFSGGNIFSTDGGQLAEIGKTKVENTISDIKFQSLPAKVEAEDFILQNGTETEGTVDEGGGKNIGYIHPGDWLDYAIDVPKKATYTLKLRVSGVSEGSVVFQTPGLTGDKDIASYNIPVTGGWQNWVTQSYSIKLDEGKQYLRIKALKDGFNFNYFEIESQ